MRYSFLIFLLLCSCSEEKISTNHIIKINVEDEFNTSLPDLSIKSIARLETNDISIFGKIDHIEYQNNKIYLFDAITSKTVMVFSNKGQFINKTKFGRGPDEMAHPIDFFVDVNNKNVFVYDLVGFIYKYDLDLNFLSKEKYNGAAFIEFAKLNERDLLIHSHFDENYKYTLYSYNELDTLKKQFIPDYEYSGSQRLFRAISIKNRILLISPFDYNVYQLVNNEIHSEYYFDFGKYKITRDDIETKGISHSWTLVNEGKRVSSLKEISESDNFLLFHVYFKREEIYYVYSFDMGKTYRMNNYFEKGLLPKCQIKGSIEGDTFYALVKPIDMMEFQENKKQKFIDGEIDLDQNPMLLTFSLSELENNNLKNKLDN